MSQHPGNPQHVHRRRVQASMQISDAPSVTSKRATSARKRKSGTTAELQRFWKRIPAVLRIILAALIAMLLLTMTVAVTRSYLIRQEERRRLEAEAAERAQHPLMFADHISHYSGVYELDPALVSAIILSESSFDPIAESRLGARGLMQLMPDTAEWVAHKLDEDDETYTFDKLYDPEVAIRYGCWYLGYLSRRFSGDATKIICAYHAGQGNVNAWLKNPKYSKDGVTLDTIPYENTATYCSRVLRSRDVYRKYYFPVVESTAVPAEGESEHVPQV
jgi:soluble lytic murein transglycosylase